MSPVITQGSKITLHFTLSLEGGEIIDSTQGKQPASCTIGDGNFLPGFEAVLLGLQAGDVKTFVIAPENAFGFRRDENIHVVPRIQFDTAVELVEGLIMNFADGKATLPGVIKQIQDDVVTVDFNHPLASQKIVFTVDILDVESPCFIKVKTV